MHHDLDAQQGHLGIRAVQRAGWLYQEQVAGRGPEDPFSPSKIPAHRRFALNAYQNTGDARPHPKLDPRTDTA